LRQIVRELEKAPGHTLPEEYFLSLMEEHFDEDESQEQLDTAINWGRYAELFTFQNARGVFRLEEPEAAETI
jgi:NitT/TauT family transport system ATP-binding protein